ncbi:MAG: M20/M25/M40 family metallo-hydrolase [Acidobacteriota bacterium]|nr:M20/M25/M40 family metallo-hydrolase [Acidobacteriota bacterium]
MKVLIAVLLFLPAVGGRAADTPEIKQEEITRIVGVLAHDDMQGRMAGTAGARKAADFIASEFKAIGLKPYAGNDYLQKFNAFSIASGETSLNLNGTVLDPASYHVSFSGRECDLSDKSKLAIEVVEEGGQPFRVLRKMWGGEKIPVLLIPPSMEDRLKQLKAYQGGGLSMATEENPAYVMIMTDQTQVDDFKLSVRNKMEPTELANVVGVIPGKSKPNEYVMFSGHYDHLGDRRRSVDGDTIANGADDNASGTTGVIALARYFQSLPRQPERSLVFIAFTAEEIGGFGSEYFASVIDPDQYVAGINIEMIGKPSKFGPGTVFMTGPEKSSLFEIMQKASGESFLHPDPYPKQNLFNRSDNARFARVGVPAHSISSSQIDQDKLYHTVNDEFETLDLGSMTRIIRGIAVAAMPLVDGSATPTRIETGGTH